MLRLQILCLLGLLAAASSINPTLKKSSFFLPNAYAMTSPLFQTRNGIITYVIEEVFTPSHQYLPNYALIDLEAQNATQILSNLTVSCGQNNSIFDKLHYHASTYTLLYYCSNNNTLLILDEDDYSVQQTIPFNVTAAFDEVRMTTDGYSVVILGLTGLLTASPSPTHLFKVSMQSRDIVNHVIFDHNLNSGEAVTAYASNGNSFYVLTNTIEVINHNESNIWNTVTIYSMTLIANSYQLTPLVNFSSAEASLVNELYCVENLIVSNNFDELIIMSDEGSILQRILDLSSLLYRTQLFSDYGSSDFYALWQNSTISKFSALNQGYTSGPIGSAFNIQIAAKNQDSNTLLFAIAYNVNTHLFSITDLSTLKIVHQAVTNPTQIMLTPVTYCPIWFQDNVQNIEFYIFDLETDALIKYYSQAIQTSWYYDQENYIFSFLELDQTNHYQVVQFDFQTGNSANFSTNLTTDNHPALIHATNQADLGAPQYVILNQSYPGQFVIMSQALGNIVFTPNYGYSTNTIIVNYDSLLIYYFYFSLNQIVAQVYFYDQPTQRFILEETVSNNVASLFNLYSGPGYALAYGESIGIIDVQSLELVNYSVPVNSGAISIFQGSSNDVRFILSPNAYTPSTPTLFDNGTFQTLPGSNNSTGGAGVTGACSYWVGNVVAQNVVTVEFWDICSDESAYNSIISI